MKLNPLTQLMLLLICCLFELPAQAQSVPVYIVKTQKDMDAGRIKIDSLDNLLMKILGERERIAGEIGAYKAKNHIPPLQEARFKQVLAKSIAAGKAEGLSAEFIAEMMNAIHKESLRIENDSTLSRR